MHAWHRISRYSRFFSMRILSFRKQNLSTSCGFSWMSSRKSLLLIKSNFENYITKTNKIQLKMQNMLIHFTSELLAISLLYWLVMKLQDPKQLPGPRVEIILDIFEPSALTNSLQISIAPFSIKYMNISSSICPSWKII